MDIEATEDVASPEAAHPVVDDLAKMRELAKASGDKWREEHAHDEPAEEPAAAAPEEAAPPPAKSLTEAVTNAAEADAPPSDGEPEPELRKLLRARQEKQEAREESRAAAQAREEAQRALAEAKRMLEEARAEKDLVTRRLRSEPLKAFRELGLDPSFIAEETVRDGSPEARARAELEAMREEERRERAKIKADLEEVKQARAQEWAQYQAMQKAQGEKAFLELAASGKYPAARSLMSDKALLREAYDRIEEARRNDVHCTDHQILEDLEHEARQAAKKALPTLSELLGKVTAEAATGAADQGERASKGPRTLSAQSASERRATPRPISQLTPDEADAEMRRIARESFGAAATTPATKANGKAQRT